MNWKKIQWIFGVLFVFLLILSTNLIDQGNFNKIQKSIKNIYEDRLVAQDVVFKFTKLIAEKDMANALADTAFYASRNAAVNNEINDLIGQYEETNLTREEVLNFNEFKAHLLALKELEKSSVENDMNQYEAVKASIASIKTDLRKLADIQIAEGWRELKAGKKAASSIAFATQMEIYILLFLAIIIQLLIIYTPKSLREKNQDIIETDENQ